MSVPRLRQVLVAAAACAAAVSLAVCVPAAERPSCTEILRELTRAAGHPGIYRPDADKLARKLGTDAGWVARCAETYGRRVKRDPVKGEKVTLDEVLAEETGEADEIDDRTQEEIDTKGDQYVTVLEDDEEKRHRLKNFNADSSAELNPFDTHEWAPHTGYEWAPILHDDDHPNEE